MTKKVKKKTVKKKNTKPILKKNERLVKFSVPADAGSEVFVAGSFNNWDPTANKLRKYKENYITSIVLPVGRYEYKFIINGIWHVDPNCDEWQPNDMGSINSVITVE